jgi:hypothetical protein
MVKQIHYGKGDKIYKYKESTRLFA